MPNPRDTDPSDALDASSALCLERTRSWVLNVMVVDGLTILATALILRSGGGPELDANPDLVRKVAFGGLFVVFVVAMLVLRRLGSRERLAWPSTRASRFFASRVGAAAIGWAALPLGLYYGLGADASLQGVLPFWLAAMVLGKFAYPRRIELEGFDDAPPPPEDTP